MSDISIPISRLVFGNEHWRSHRAIDEMEVYCELVGELYEKANSLETRGKDKEMALVNAAAVISSYAFEIGMKSLWALDNSSKPVPHKHNLLFFFNGLKAETKESLKQLGLTRDEIKKSPEPFLRNRYSMEEGSRTVFVSQPQFLRSLSKLLQKKLEKELKEMRRPPTNPPQ